MRTQRLFTELLQYRIDPQAADLLPVEYCVEHLVTILGEVPEDRTLPITVGMVNVRDDVRLDDLRQRLGRDVNAVQLNSYEIRQALSRLHGVAEPESGLAIQLSVRREIDFSPDLPASKMVDDLLSVAVRRGATDVHIEVYQADVDLRFRIDGFLRQVTTPLSPENVRRVVSRLKVLADLDPTSRRHAQDGRFAALYSEATSARRVDFRLSVLPGNHGEDAVIRLLDPERFHLELDKLGMPDDLLSRYRRLISFPSGLILVAGPTLSGKTNTLYATISTLRERDVKIVTVEDPIEYEFPKINQKNITQDLDFPDYVRAFLRQNPDVMLVGEVRDEQTADTVIQAATTGHLVLSSVHTRDAVSTIARLRALGISNDTIATTLVATIGQRLLGRICEDCKEESTPDPELVALYYDEPPTHPFYKGKGCESCVGSGYFGLVATFELLEMSHSLTRAIGEGAGLDVLEDLALQQGFVPLINCARQKVEAGLTTLEEIGRRVMPPPMR